MDIKQAHKILKGFSEYLNNDPEASKFVSEEEQEMIFNNKKKNKDNTLLGKVFSYFFDN